MGVDHEIHRELNRLRRRAWIAEALGVAARLAVAGGTLLVVAVLGSRLLDQPLAPDLRWLLALVPVGVVAGVLATRRTPPAAILAVHLDRRLAADGLLVAALERDAGGWSAELRERLGSARRVAPRVRAAPAVARLLAAPLAVAALALLPAPAATSAPRRTMALERAIEDARGELELFTAAGLLDEREAIELAKRADELRDRLLAGERVAWSDVDALAERIERSGEVGAAGLQAVAAGTADLLGELDVRGLEPRDVEVLARLAEHAAELGMLDGLTREEREVLGRLAELGGAADPGGERGGGSQGAMPSGLDPERLRRLAEELGSRSGNRLQRAAATARGAAPRADALRKLLESQGVLDPHGGGAPQVARGGDGFDPRPGGDGSGAPGRGGLGRGRGDAVLEHIGDSDVEAAGLRAERLPPGVFPPDRWDVAALGIAEPDVAPERGAPGTAGAAPHDPGDVTFRRDLAPRHREAVRRFFGDRR